MKDLLKYIISGITKSDEFKIEESTDGDRIIFEVKAKPDIIGIIIGKKGTTIRSIRNIIKIQAVLEKKSVSVNVSEF